MPLVGVFVVTAQWQGKEIRGVANVGTRPTVNGVEPNLEVHFLDFDQDLYGQHVKIEFLEKIRDVIKFEDLDALKRQIEHDIGSTRAFFDQRKSD